MKTRNRLYDKSRLRLLCLLTALLGLFGAGQTWAANGTTSGMSSTHRGAVVGGTAANISGGQADNIYFGTYQQSSDGSGGYNTDPIKWRVLENADGQLFLLSDQNLDVFQYHTDRESVTWEKSTMRSWLNGYGASENTGGDSGIDYTSDNFISAAFSEKEQAAIAETTVVNDDNGSIEDGNDTTDKIFLLSIAEANNSSYFADNDSRISTNTAYVADGGKIDGNMYGVGTADYWWLRSPGEETNCAAIVGSDGVVYSHGPNVDNAGRAVRPAFYLDLNSVLFTSAAAGGKSASGMDSGLTAVGDYAGSEWKLTLLDDSRDFSVTETTVSGYPGTTVTLHYSGATTGTNEYISVLLTNEQGNALYYGRVAEPNSAEGEVSLTIPDALAAGTYTLNVFSEQYNGDYQTDYASAFEAVTMTVHAIPGQLDGVYQIETAEDLFWFAALVNGTLEGTAQNAAACAVLTTHIDLTGGAWTPIGSESNPYTGTFDGQNHTISGMTLENVSSDYQGFVGYLGENGKIQDLTLDANCSVTGGKNTGGLCGWNNAGTITACTNKGAVNGSGDLGGICGHNLGTVDNCANTGTVYNGDKNTAGGICGYSKTALTGCTNSGAVTGSTYVGGIVGYTDDGAIENCQNSGTVTGNGEDVGGICGFSNQPITNCANTGNIAGGNVVGGVCGLMVSSKVTISNCYNTGTVTGTGTDVGAVYGKNGRGQSGDGQGTITNCYYQSEETTSTQEGATPKTADEFKSGKVACLLQGDQTEQAWGQTLGTDDYPVPTTDEAMRVYAAKLYNGSADKVSELYTNASGISLPEEPNALLVIEDAVSAPTGMNVVVKSGDAYTCANFELTDGTDFYTPVAFTAAQATYSRPLTEGTQWGTVALPFNATTVTGAELFRVDRQDGDALYVDETNVMAGGEPLVFRANAEVTEVGFKGTNVTVRATDEEAGSTLLKGTSQIVSSLDAGAYFIYGDKFYQVASGSQVGVKPFRAYIPAAAGVSTRSAGAASQLRIIFNADK